MTLIAIHGEEVLGISNIHCLTAHFGDDAGEGERPRVTGTRPSARRIVPRRPDQIGARLMAGPAVGVDQC